MIKAEKEKIIQEIYNLVLSGHTNDYIKKYIKEKTGKNLCDKTFWRLFKKVYEIIKEESKKWKSEALSLAINRYNDIIKKAQETQNYKLVLFAQERLDKILGLETQEINININNSAIKELFDFYTEKDDDK